MELKWLAADNMTAMMKQKLPQFVKYGRLISLDSPDKLGKNIQREPHVFEKIDGGNCQVRNCNWRLLPGSKANYLKGQKIDEHPWFKKFVKWVYSNDSLYSLPQDVIMFGEWLGNHTISYDSKRVDRFYVLDVLDLNARRFLPYELAKEFLGSVGVRDVEFLDIKAKGRVGVSEIERILFEPSDYYAGEKEGVVVKCYDKPQTFFRIYHPEHSETNDRKEGNLMAPSRFSRAVYRIMDRNVSDRVKFNDVIEEVIRDVVRDGEDLPNKKLVIKKLSYYLKNNALKDTGQKII